MADGERKQSPYAPLIGFVLAVIVGVIAWLVAPDVIHWLAQKLPYFAGNEIPFSTMRIIFAAILFVLALIVFGLVAALLVPKAAKPIQEAHMERERDALRRRQKAERDERRQW